MNRERQCLERKTMKMDCFARKQFELDSICVALNSRSCEGCKFYKSIVDWTDELDRIHGTANIHVILSEYTQKGHTDETAEN